MSEFLIKAVKAKRISPEEKDTLMQSLGEVRKALSQNSSPDPVQLSATACRLFLFANANDSALAEVIRFIDWFEQGGADSDFSPELKTIVEGFFPELQWERVGMLLEKINAQVSLTQKQDARALISHLNDPHLKGLYHNQVDALDIDFSVSVLPFDLEVLDPRIVTIRPGKANEMHRHAHETVFIFLSGNGKVIVDEYENEVKPGDFALIPRWCNHQSVNTGAEDLVFLAVADFGLTGKSFMGNYMKTARMKSV
jgi:quercetin dioxygenase-like cupin family protein